MTDEDQQVPFAPLTDGTLERESNHNAHVAVLHVIDGSYDLALKRAKKAQEYRSALLARIEARLAKYEQQATS